jgi:alpha-L-fucosidase
MIEAILVGSFVFLTLLFMSLYVVQIKKNRAMIANTLQLLIMQQSASDENKTDKDKANEDFLKFVSDSRDWAYQYIEDVQAKINKFISDVEPEIAYFDEYGVVGSAYPHYYSMKKISGAYKELKTILPDDYDRIEYDRP